MSSSPPQKRAAAAAQKHTERMQSTPTNKLKRRQATLVGETNKLDDQEQRGTAVSIESSPVPGPVMFELTPPGAAVAQPLPMNKWLATLITVALSIAVFNSLDASVQDMVFTARSGNWSLWSGLTRTIPTWGLIAIASFVSWVSIDATFGTSTFFTDELSGLLHSVVCSVLVGATALSDLSTGRDMFCFCSCRIDPPWTATVISSVTLGYGFYDVAVGLFRLKRWDYSLHGLVLICSCGAVCYSHQGHHVAYAMFMEWSTVFLNLRVLNSIFIDFTFVLLFFVMRIGVVPIIWTRWMIVFFLEGSTETSCIPAVVPYAALFGGIILHSLNCFWGRLVLFKFLRVLRSRYREGLRQQQGKDRDPAAKKEE